MKAKIKKTGEIINLASYATIAFEQCDSFGNPIELRPEDVEIIQEQTEDEHWQDIKERAAIAAMQGFLSRQTYRADLKTLAKDSVTLANYLIEELKRK